MAKGEVRFRLVAETAQAKKALDEVQNQVEKLGKDFSGKLGPAGAVLEKLGPAGLAAAAGIGAVTVAVGLTAKALTDATAAAVAYGGKFQDLSDSTGIAADALQRMAAFGKPTSTSIEEIAGAVKKLEKALTDTPEQFAQLGLSAAKLKAMRPDEAFAAVAAQVNKLGTQSEKTAASLALFGKGFDLKLLKTDFESVGATAERLGNVMSSEMIGSLDDVGDAAGLLSDTWEHLWLNIGGAVASSPEVLEAFHSLTESLGEVNRWIIENQDSLRQLGSIAASVFQAWLGATREVVAGLKVVAGAVRDVIPKDLNLKSFAEWMKGDGDLGGGLHYAYFGGGIKNTPNAGTKGGKPTWTADAGKKAAEELSAAQEKWWQRQEEAELKEEAAFGKMAVAWAQLVGPGSAEIQASVETIAATLKDKLAEGAELSAHQIGELAKKLQALRDVSPEGFAAAAGGLPQNIDWAHFQELKPANISGAGDLIKTTQYIYGAKAETIDWTKALAATADMFQVLGISADSGLGRVLGGLTAGMASLQALQKQMATGGGGIGGLFKDSAGKTGLGSIVSGITGALGAVSAAVSIGKAIFGLFHKSPAEKAAKDAGKYLGMTVSKEMGQKIADTAKKLNISTRGAELLNLSALMGESGRDPRKFVSQITDLMNAIKSGAVPAAEGVQQLGESFQMVADAALKAGSVGDKALVSLIKQSRDSGISSPEIKAFVQQQLGRAASGVGGLVKIDARTQEQAEAQATIFSAAFWATVKEDGIVKAGDAFKDVFASLSEKLSGFDVSGILGPVSDLIGLSGNETFRGAIEGADGLREALEGIANAGYLTADSFGAFENQAAAAYSQAMEGGASSAQALQAIAPLLQSLQTASENYGINLDASTQALIEQAKAAGVAFKTDPIDRMAAGIDRLVVAMEKLAGISGDVAGSFRSLGDSSAGLGNVQPGHVEGFANEGYVPPRRGGTLIRVGEGGQGEYITHGRPGSAGTGGLGAVSPVSIAGITIMTQPGEDVETFGRRFVQILRDNVAQARDNVLGLAPARG